MHITRIIPHHTVEGAHSVEWSDGSTCGLYLRREQAEAAALRVNRSRVRQLVDPTEPNPEPECKYAAGHIPLEF
jgi:hypothetical protein